jgi:hypothetical protein
VQSVLERLARNPIVARAEFWEAVDPEQVAVAKEERLRGGDQKIRAMLERRYTSRGRSGCDAADLSSHFPAVKTGVYRFLCEIGRGDV